jgi:hypothetical protein
MINIVSNHKCLTTSKSKPTYFTMETCDMGSSQNFTYDNDTYSIKQNHKCLDVDKSNLILAPCETSASQQWYFSNGTLRNMTRTCLGINGDPTINGAGVEVTDCNGTINQDFQYLTPQITQAIILRASFNFPSNTLPIPKDSVISPYHVVIGNNDKNILISPGTHLDSNSAEINCLGKILYFLMGPLTSVIIWYIDDQNNTQSLVFHNISLEHCLYVNQDTCFSPDLKKSIRMITAYDINSFFNLATDTVYQIKSSFRIQNHIPYGSIFYTSGEVSDKPTIYQENTTIDLTNFKPIDMTTVISSNQVNDYIVGPLTYVIFGNITFYNSYLYPLLYHQVSGVSGLGTKMVRYLASPLYAGYVIFSDSCSYRPLTPPIFIGRYSINPNSPGTQSIQNTTTRNLIYYTNENSKNPIILLGDKNINSFTLGPYTSITLHNNATFTGTTISYVNNSHTELTIDLCSQGYTNFVSSLEISFSSGYVGYGIISPPTPPMRILTYKEACKPTIEGFVERKDPIWIFLAIIIVLLFLLLLTHKWNAF